MAISINNSWSLVSDSAHASWIKHIRFRESDTMVGVFAWSIYDY